MGQPRDERRFCRVPLVFFDGQGVSVGGYVSLEEVERLLVEWGKWTFVGVGSRHAHGTLAGLFGDDRTLPDISDEMALRVDRIVAQLCVAEPLTGALVIDHYREELGYRFLADQYKISSGKVSALVGSGKAFVQGALINFSDAA